jgi:hypothetical protein
MIPKKPAPDFDPGWAPMFGKDHAPSKKLEQDDNPALGFGNEP